MFQQNIMAYQAKNSVSQRKNAEYYKICEM